MVLSSYSHRKKSSNFFQGNYVPNILVKEFKKMKERARGSDVS